MNKEEKERIIAENFEGGIELPDELLEHIAGGVFDQEAIAWTRENYGRLKRYGVSLPDALEMLGEGSTDYEEVLRYVEENWDNL